MRIAILHNRYREPGGEDNVVAQEVELLRQHGHEIITFYRDNRDIQGQGSVGLALQTVWSRDSVAELRQFLTAERPDLVHVHNTLPLLSPAVFHVAHNLGYPTVLTLHNVRLLCPGSTFFRDGAPCTVCLGRSFPWPSVLHACYRDSRAASATVTAMNAVHRALGTWTRKVSAFIALTEFAKTQFVDGGLPAELMHVRSNYVDDPEATAIDVTRPDAPAVYVGRISEEKGIRTLLEAWRNMKVPLEVYGDGPLLQEARKYAPPCVRLHGQVSREKVSQAMREAAFLVMPSVCYEGFPLSVLEAFSFGLPVVASRLGALAEIVSHEVTGLHFEVGAASSLAYAVERMASDPILRADLGERARTEYLDRYTPGAAYLRLLEIYESVL